MSYTNGLDDPTIYFNTVTWTGDGSSSRNITGVGFQPDWVWGKCRNTTVSHALYDSVRGGSKLINSNATSAEGTNAALSAFVSDGFSINSDSYFNGNSNTYVAWNWKAGGSAPAITYVVKVVSDSGNKYRFDDFGTSAVTLDLQEGGTYTFDLSDSSNDGHPMKFSETSNGSHGGGSTYSTGIVYQLDGASVTESNYVSNFNSASSRKIIITVSASAPTLYYFCHYHSGMGGQANTNSTFGSSNFSGSIQSTVSANTTAGFSIVKWSASANKTIGHGLGQKPAMVITKSRDTATNWATWHKNLTGGSEEDRFLNLNSSGASTTYTDYFGTGGFTSSIFGVSTSGFHNNAGEMIAYCFAEKKGYSKFGSYTGNGSSDGTFIFTGFRPAWIMQKKTSGTSNWVIYDNKRDPSNVVTQELKPDVSNAESSFTNIDILSNGFKQRANYAYTNNSGGTYIYMAFAESPFVNSNGVPNNAR